jgi:DNA recombination protein RmuC
MTTVFWLLISLLVIVVGSLVFLLLKFQLKGRENKNLEEEIRLLKQDIHQGLDLNERRIKETLEETRKSYSRMQRELGQLQEIGRDMKGLQKVLQSPKLRGNLGEQVMKDLLEEIIPRERVSCQYSFPGGEVVDAILKTENGLIPIDSKYSLEAFRMMKKTSGSERQHWEGQFRRGIKKHLRSIAQKYIQPQAGTVDFAVMYLPSESVYYELLINYSDLLEESYRQKVYLVSPNTFYYFLKVIMVGLEGVRIEAAAQEILRGVQSLQVRTDKLGKGLQVLFGHVQRAYSASEKVNQDYQQLNNNVEQIRSLETESPKKIED